MTAVLRDKQLTKNFRASELRCRCRQPGCTAPPMDPGFLIKLQRLRDLWGSPLTVTSGLRCRAWNTKVAGSPNSLHLLGKAADLLLENPEDGPRLSILAEKAGMGGVGLDRGFIHVDDGPSGRRWSY